MSGAMTGGFLLWAMLSPLAGAVVDRGGAGRAMRVAGLAGAMLLLVAAWSRDVWVLCAALSLLGAPMAMTLYDPCFSVMVRRFGPAARGPITLITLIAGLATLLTFPLVWGLVALGLGWRGILVAFAAIAILGVLILPGDVDVRVEAAPTQPVAPAAFGPRTVAFGLAFAVLMFGHAALLFRLPGHLADTRGMSGALVLPMVLGPSQIAGRLLWERVQGRVAIERAALGLFVVFLVPPVLLLLGGGLGLAIAALVLQGACYGVHTILRPLLAARWMPGDGFARRLGVIAMIGLLLMAVAPAAGAWAMSVFGATGLWSIVLVADLAGLMLLSGLLMRAPREGRA